MDGAPYKAVPLCAHRVPKSVNALLLLAKAILELFCSFGVQKMRTLTDLWMRIDKKYNVSMLLNTL